MIFSTIEQVKLYGFTFYIKKEPIKKVNNKRKDRETITEFLRALNNSEDKEVVYKNCKRILEFYNRNSIYTKTEIASILKDIINEDIRQSETLPNF